MTTIIAITNKYNDTVTMFPPSANLPNVGEVLFHSSPNLEFNGEKLERNFDYHFDFCMKPNRLHRQLIPDNYFHYPRQRRIDQYINTYKFNQMNNEELLIPKFYSATQRTGEHVRSLNFGLPDCEKVVIKPQLGARGSNQIVCPTNMLTTVIKHSKDKSLGEIKEMFPDLIYTDNSDWDTIYFSDLTELFISELITGVKQEFRLLVSGDKIYARERVIKQGPYPQANLEVGLWPTIPVVKYEPIRSYFSEELVSTLEDYVKSINLPFGSIDLFLTQDGRWGIFEYSSQFAFHGADPLFVRNMLLNAVDYTIHQRLKKQDMLNHATHSLPSKNGLDLGESDNIDEIPSDF